jgi:outer membrane lipoprotein-sorting protein
MTTRLVNLIVAGLLVSSSVAVHAQTQPTPREIINAMVATYKTASSYQDTGKAVVVKTNPRPVQGAPHIGHVLVSYRTYFVRPNMFRFDWKSPRTRLREASVWSTDGKKTYLWIPEVGVRDDRFTFRTSTHLDMAIMDAARSSAGAVWPLIGLFIKEANVVMSFADHLDMATELTLVREEPIDGEMCYVIKANFSGDPWTLWIAKQRKILRKTRTVYSYGSFDESVETGVRHEYVAEETHRDVKINEPISKDVFNYRPALRPNDFDLTR